MGEPRHTRLYHFTHCNVRECHQWFEDGDEERDPFTTAMQSIGEAARHIGDEIMGSIHMDDLQKHEGSTSYVGPKRDINWAVAFGYTCAWITVLAILWFLVDGLIWFTRVCI